MSDRLEAIRARRAKIKDDEEWKHNSPDQPEKQPGFWLAYAQGPVHPAYSRAEIDDAWWKAKADQEVINAMPFDIDYLLQEVERLRAENAKLKEENQRWRWRSYPNNPELPG